MENADILQVIGLALVVYHAVMVRRWMRRMGRYD